MLYFRQRGTEVTAMKPGKSMRFLFCDRTAEDLEHFLRNHPPAEEAVTSAHSISAVFIQRKREGASNDDRE